jgi:acetylornithine deacetylase
MERRIRPGEAESAAITEVRAILQALCSEDPTFRAEATAMFSRPAYEVPVGHELPAALAAVLHANQIPARTVGASFWADSAVLGEAGTPSVLFGPGGAGLHSIEEFVILEDVLRCRDVLAGTARRFC